MCVKVMLSAVKVLRYSDGMRGGNDEDESPHRVSGSESESESEQNSEYFFVSSVVTHRVSVFIFLYFCIASSHSWKPNMLFPEYHNRFRYTAHVSFRKWVFINQQELFLLNISKKKSIFF